MSDKIQNKEALRAARDALRGQLAILDRLGEAQAAIDINSGIEILNGRLGEKPTAEDIEQMKRRLLSDQDHVPSAGRPSK